jgi:hypothetical protein
MMALIALAAVLLVAERARRHWRVCRYEVRVCSVMETTYLRLAAISDEAAAERRERYERYMAEASPTSAILAAEVKESGDRIADDAKHCREVAARAARRRAQYQRAMFRPWESIPPEPP